MSFVFQNPMLQSNATDGTALGAADKPLNMTAPESPMDGLTDDSAGGGTSTVSWSAGGISGEASQGLSSSPNAVDYRDANGGSGNMARAATFARQYIGTMYKWGGTGPLGFDCSGLIQYAVKQITGKTIARVSAQQATSGAQVSRDAARAGDIVWFDNSSRNRGADHVAFYLGNGQILEAPGAGKPVRIRTLGKNERAGFTRLDL